MIRGERIRAVQNSAAFFHPLGIVADRTHGIDGATRKTTGEILYGHGHGAKRSLRDLMQVEHSHIRGDRIKATRVHDLRAGLLCFLVPFINCATDEKSLAAQVYVVSTVHNASFDDFIAIVGIRAHGRNHHPCAFCKCIKRW